VASHEIVLDNKKQFSGTKINDDDIDLEQFTPNSYG